MDQPLPPSEPVTPEKGRGPGKITNSLVALGSAAVFTVYAAGYLRTRAAAARFAVEAADLRTAIPPGATAGPPVEAEPPRELVDAGKPDEPAPAVPAPAAPNTEASAPPSRIVSAETSPTPAVDSVESADPKGPALQPASSQPTPPPTEAPIAQASAEPAPGAVPADVDSAKAEPPAPPPVPPPAPRQGQYKDGKFSGWGYSRHGDIEAAVVIQDGRVVSAEITQCLTRYSCDIIDMLPAQVIGRQNAFVDLISGATESANAYSNAIFRALKLAK